MKRRLQSGFTLLEMLIVIGIIAILSAVLAGAYLRYIRSADKAKCQELVSNALTSIVSILQNESAWPTALITASKSGDGLLDQSACVALARRNLMSLSYTRTGPNDDGTYNYTLNGSDRFGLVDPWAAAVVKRSASLSSGTGVPSGGTLRDHTLHFAIDLDCDGITEAHVGGTTLKIRASAAVWDAGANGVVDGFRTAGRNDDVYSWQKGQVVR